MRVLLDTHAFLWWDLDDDRLSDIARAVTEPEIDFSSGTLLTNSVVEAARTQGVNTIVYALSH